jgi:endonuclease/exonuclease/phosphatase family metal-dependent hydrolase
MDAHGRPSLAVIADSLGRVNADVVLLQEVDRFFPRSRFADESRLLGELLGMRAHFYGRLRFGRSGFGNVILTRLETTDVRRVALGAVGSGGEPRAALGIALAGGPMIWNTHLGLNPEWRHDQLDALADAVGIGASPVIVGGDFNTGLEADEIQTFLGRTGLSPVSGDAPTFPVPHPTHRIDFLFARGMIRQDAGTIAAPGSDHCLIWADLTTEAA